MIDAILGWVGKFLGWLDGLTGNYMYAMFLFALVVEIVMIPFGILQQKNSRKQARLRPKEMAIRNKYKGRNDKATQQKMNEEIQQMYQEEKFNQLSGCLPLLIQLPIILALYNVVINPLKYVLGLGDELISTMANFANAPISSSGLGAELGNVTNNTIALADRLSQEVSSSGSLVEGLTQFTGSSAVAQQAANLQFPDFSFFGLNLAHTPELKWDWLLLIPVLTFLVYFGSMKISRRFTYQPTVSDDPAQKKAAGCSNWVMDISMPLISVFVCFRVPAAVGVYWIFKSILGTVKQFIFSKVMPMPVFTEEDYKAAEKEYSGKTVKQKEYKVDFEAHRKNPNSLFAEDDEDYISPEEQAKIDAKLAESDSDAPAPQEDDSGLITKATLKDDQKKK